MTKAMLTKTATAALAIGMGLVGLATPATAATILIFAENGATPPGFVVIQDDGNGATSMATDIPVTITDLAGPWSPRDNRRHIHALGALNGLRVGDGHRWWH
jgi:hypothetical protein